MISHPKASIPYYGLTAGDSAADAGFTFAGAINTKIDEVNYVVRLTYTAVTKSYAISTHAYRDDFKSIPFEATSCLTSVKAKNWLTIPRAQENMNECEFDGCENLPRD